jgi:hypothetical protein
MEKIMSDGTGSYDANYGGYQDWYADKNTQYEKILNDKPMSENDPIEWILSLLGCIMSTEYGDTGWVGESIGHAADDTTTIANLQGLFSNPDAYTPAEQTQILQQTNDLYAQAANDTDPNNPFYDTDQETQSQLQAIMPPTWVFTNPDGSAATVGAPGSPDTTTSATSYFNSIWTMAASGNTSPLTAEQTAFNTENSSLTGISQQLQSESEYISKELEQIEGLFQNTTKAVSGVTSQSVNNEIPS